MDAVGCLFGGFPTGRVGAIFVLKTGQQLRKPSLRGRGYATELHTKPGREKDSMESRMSGTPHLVITSSGEVRDRHCVRANVLLFH